MMKKKGGMRLFKSIWKMDFFLIVTEHLKVPITTADSIAAVIRVGQDLRYAFTKPPSESKDETC